MLQLTKVVDTFPASHIENTSGALPVEVSLIAQLGHGAGNHLFASVAARQTAHNEFIDELDEPSVKLGGVNLSLGDTTSLYSFIVGPKGHPFHKHAGHRIFTAISGSGGAQLRFSTVSAESMEQDPQRFIDEMRFINIPPDCLFTVRFGGETWHQFWPLAKNSLHPVFFALSAHTDELGGNISEALKETIEANDANITVLTELLPDAVSKLLHSNAFDESAIPTTTLALDAAAGTIQRKACDGFRGKIGMLRGAWGRWYRAGGFISYAHVAKNVAELSSAPESSLLHEHLDDLLIHHDDTFILEMRDMDVGSYTASQLLERVLEGFLLNAPKAVSHMMSVRNILVTPLGLRTSPLGCPVSSLLSDDTSNLFADKYPVLDKRIADSGKEAQVILGANDKHLIFRSCVGVEIKDTRHVNITLGSRVHCKNWFGIFYMRMIDLVHRRYISPTMLRRSVDYMASQLKR